MPAHTTSRHADAPDSAWKRWRRLSALDREATLAAAFLIPLVHASLKTLGARRTRRIFERARPSFSQQREADRMARSIAHAVARASRCGAWRGNCFSRSIVLMRLLGRHGIDAQLRYGARMQANTLDAHAWVERNGVPLNDSPSVTQRFAALGPGGRSDL